MGDKLEVTCANPECPYRPPAGLEDAGPYRNLVEGSVFGLPIMPCPACGQRSLRLLSVRGPDARLALGRTLATPGVLDTFSPTEVASMLRRHLRGDWGELDKEDKQANEQALQLTDGIPNGRVMSVYRYKEGRSCYVITERGRQSTTVLLPEEY